MILACILFFHIDEDLLGDMGVNWGGGRWIKVSIHRPSETDVMVSDVVSRITSELILNHRSLQGLLLRSLLYSYLTFMLNGNLTILIPSPCEHDG